MAVGIWGSPENKFDQGEIHQAGGKIFLAYGLDYGVF